MGAGMRIALVAALFGVLIGCCDTEGIPKEIKRLYSSQAKDRNDAALALARCSSPEVDRAVPRLIALMYDENVGVQSAAAYALRKIDNKLARDALERATAQRANRR